MKATEVSLRIPSGEWGLIAARSGVEMGIMIKASLQYSQEPGFFQVTWTHARSGILLKSRSSIYVFYPDNINCQCGPSSVIFNEASVIAFYTKSQLVVF